MEGGRDPERQKGRGGEALRGPGTHQQKYSWDENICCTQGARRGVHSGQGAPEPCQNQSRRVGIRVSRSQDGGFVLRTRTSLGLSHWTEGNSHRKSEEKGSNQRCKQCVLSQTSPAQAATASALRLPPVSAGAACGTAGSRGVSSQASSCLGK